MMIELTPEKQICDSQRSTRNEKNDNRAAYCARSLEDKTSIWSDYR
jgi:hypothetical protein